MRPRTKCISCGNTPVLPTGRCRPCEKEIDEWTQDVKREAPIPRGSYRYKSRVNRIMDHITAELDKR